MPTPPDKPIRPEAVAVATVKTTKPRKSCRKKKH